MDRWAYLLPYHIRTSFVNPINQTQNVLFPFTYHYIAADSNTETCYDPNEDVYMLRAKIKALEDYVFFLQRIIEEYEGVVYPPENIVTARHSDPGVYLASPTS